MSNRPSTSWQSNVHDRGGDGARRSDAFVGAGTSPAPAGQSLFAGPASQAVAPSTARRDSTNEESLRTLLGRRGPLLGLVAAASCGLDLATKHWMFRQPGLLAGEVQWVWPEYAGFQLSLNEGALFGMGQGQVPLFVVFSLIALAAIPTWLFATRTARDLRLTIVMGLILGGILGNLFDRLGWHGLQWEQFRIDRTGPVHAVRDFVLLAWEWSPDPRERKVWPNFNVADSLLVCGSAVLFLLSWTSPELFEARRPAANRAPKGAEQT